MPAGNTSWGGSVVEVQCSSGPDGNLRSRSAIEFHAFAPLEALSCMPLERPLPLTVVTVT
jgi:hypothetical protein